MTATILEVMENFAGKESKNVSLYEELAPVYDFVLARRFDHEAMARFVDARVPNIRNGIVVGGCGPGRLLERLATRYSCVVGIDASLTMLELAAARTDSHLVRADLRTVVAPRAIDAMTLLGNTLAHVGDILVATFESAHATLRPGGALVCNFTRGETLVDSHVTEDDFESDRFRVERTVVTDRESVTGSGVKGRYTYAFTVMDREKSETVRIDTSMPVRAFRPGAVLGAALDAGFAEATLVDPPTPHGGGLVAYRAE